MGLTDILSEGTIVAGDYRIVRPLASGGMGAVYVAEQISTGKQRALKVMRAEIVSEARERERFVQEARVGSLITSDHVVEVIGAGIDATTGMPWLAMELLAGEDLAQRARRRGPMPPQEVLAVFEEVCHALAAAHAAGIVHRDVKPENVFLATTHTAGHGSTVKLLDFGIAKVVAEARTISTQTLGTPLWMAPEQCTTGVPITPAADVWALGLLAFWLLTGVYYWDSANAADRSVAAVLGEVLYGPLPPASQRAYAHGRSVPPTFDAWFARCVARDAAQRFPTAAEAGLAMRAALVGQPAVAAAMMPPATMQQPMVAPMHAMAAATTAPRRTSGAPVGLIVALALLPLVLVGGGAALLFGLRERDDDRPPTANAVVTAAPVATAAPASTSTPTSTPTSTSTHASTAPTPTPPPRPSAPPPAAVRRFDTFAAKTSIDFVSRNAKTACRTFQGPRAIAAVVKFNKTGHVSSVSNSDPFTQSQPSVFCVLNQLRGAVVPPFDEPDEGVAPASLVLDPQ